MDKHGEDVSTLILGNSHTYIAIQPLLMDSTFSLANSSQLLAYDEHLLQVANEKCQNLKNVILSLDCLNLFWEKPEDNTHIARYSIYTGYRKNPRLSAYGYELYSWINVYNKITAYISSKLRGTNYELCDTLGGAKNAIYADNGFDENYPNQRLGKQIEEQDRLNCSANTEYLRRIASFCKSHNLRLILVHTPYYQLYNKYVSKHRIAEVDSVAQWMEQLYGIEFYDYRANEQWEHTDSLFGDAEHLSKVGAIRFTQEMNRLLKAGRPSE
jgi:hypothetical protein